MLRTAGVALLVLLAMAAASVRAQPVRAPILVLVSFDGWRWDYSQQISTPNLDMLARRGVKADVLEPVFPSKTFPNHYTIVTGLYPEHHGIVSNVIEDARIGARFTMSSATALDPRWWGGEPLWNTAARQRLRSASMFWPGSEVPIGGSRPTYWLPYREDMPNAARVQQVLDWLALPEGQRPGFVTLYFSDVDTAGHRYGPGSPQVAAAARRLDSLLGTLIAGIRQLGIDGRTTVAVVSDHGMSQLDPSRVIFADDYADLSAATVTEWSPVLTLTPKPGQEAALYRALKDRHPAMHVYRRSETPSSLHYRDNPRIPPIIAIADDGWTITSHGRVARDRASGEPRGGNHGYDPSVSSMGAIFVAAGPRLREGASLARLDAVDLYNLFCAVLGITPAPNDGDPAATQRLLRP